MTGKDEFPKITDVGPLYLTAHVGRAARTNFQYGVAIALGLHSISISPMVAMAATSPAWAVVASPRRRVKPSLLSKN